MENRGLGMRHHWEVTGTRQQPREGQPRLRGRERRPGARVWEQRNLAPPSPWLLSPPSLGDFDSTEKGAPTAGNLPTCPRHSPSRSRAPTCARRCLGGAWGPYWDGLIMSPPTACQHLTWGLPRGAGAPPPLSPPSPVLSRWGHALPVPPRRFPDSPAWLPHTSVRWTQLQICGESDWGCPADPSSTLAGQGSS